MANELSVTYEGAGGNLYAVLRSISANTVWNGATMVAWVDGDVAAYAVALTDQGGDLYTADVPASLPIGNYRAIYYERAGATPAITDLKLKSERLSFGTAAAEEEEELTELEAVIALNAMGPRRSQNDDQMMEQHSLPDQIAADRYLKSQSALATSKGMKFTKLIPPNQD